MAKPPFIGMEFRKTFGFSMKDVADFAVVTGDNNPIHLDKEFAATTRFKRPIMHGMLSASIFSRIFGTEYPGYGTIYLSQTLEFKRPMYPDEEYTASCQIIACDPATGLIEVQCSILDSANKQCLAGTARLMNKDVFATDTSNLAG